MLQRIRRRPPANPPRTDWASTRGSRTNSEEIVDIAVAAFGPSGLSRTFYAEAQAFSDLGTRLLQDPTNPKTRRTVAPTLLRPWVRHALQARAAHRVHQLVPR